MNEHSTYRVKNLITGQVMCATSIVTAANALRDAKDLEIHEERDGEAHLVPHQKYANADGTWLPEEILEKL